jgi:hypothetical protein
MVLRAGGIAVGSEQGGTVEQLRIYNNIVMGVSWTGIILSNTGHDSGGDGPRRDIQIWNNTVLDCTGNGGAGIYIVTTNIQNIVIQNNLIAFGDNWNGQITAATADALAELTVDHNLVFGSKHCSLDFPSFPTGRTTTQPIRCSRIPLPSTSIPCPARRRSTRGSRSLA